MQYPSEAERLGNDYLRNVARDSLALLVVPLSASTEAAPTRQSRVSTIRPCGTMVVAPSLHTPDTRLTPDKIKAKHALRIVTY